MRYLGRVAIRLGSDFSRLWVGQTISEVGSRISREGLPLTALLVLHASASEMGVLSAIGSASVLLFGLAAGVIADRSRKRSIMIAADLGRAALLALVPLAALTHRLSMPALMALAALAGVLTVLFDVAYQSYLPVLLAPEKLLEGNRRLSLSSSAAEMLGPAFTGVLVQVITAPLAILIDALSFLVSALSVWAIRVREPRTERHESTPMLAEALAGWRFIRTEPTLKALLLRSVTAFLFVGFIFPLYLLNALRIVHLNTIALGITIALGGAGSFLGAYLAGHRRVQLHGGRIFLVTAIVIGAAQLLIPLSSQFPRQGFLCLCLQQFCGDLSWTIYVVNETTLRQKLSPGLVLGRVNGAMRIASFGMLPFGALCGGFLADRFGIAPTLWMGAIGVLISFFWLWPLRNAAPASFLVPNA